MSLYKIGIIGYGVVGKGIHRLFKDSVRSIYDPSFFSADKDMKDKLHEQGVWAINSKPSFKDMDLIVISVPTNETADWSADTSILEETLEWVREESDAVILIKSTTPPSVIKELFDKYGRIVFSPEYMGESKYFTPEWKYPHPERMESHTWQTFGGDIKDTSFCVDIFKRKTGVDTQYWQTDIMTASLAKYIENSFFAMKVTFVNEWFDIAEQYGVDWNTLRELWLLDPRINRNHTLVFPRDRGYGGKCFPKDTRAIMHDVEKKGYNPKLMRAMDEVNSYMREKNAPKKN